MSESVKSSGSLAVDTGELLFAGASRIHYVSITPAAAASSIRIYDNALGDASGTLLIELNVAASTATNSAVLDCPVIALKGLSYVVAGTGATGLIHFSIL